MLAARLTAQLLAGEPAGDAVAVAERLLAVQAQDPRGARLAVRARTLGSGTSASDVDRALTEDRSLLISWLNRGTLHLVRREDWPWLHALTTPPLAASSARRLAQEGVPPDDADRGVAAVQRALAEDGPLTREQLRERVAAAGVRTEGQALVHVLLAATLRLGVVRGPTAGTRHAFALARDWLGEEALRPVERDAALAELARRYLAGHGPATDRDLARWAGLPLRDARAGLEAIASRLTQRADGLVDLAGRGRPPRAPRGGPRGAGAARPAGRVRPAAARLDLARRRARRARRDRNRHEQRHLPPVRARARQSGGDMETRPRRRRARALRPALRARCRRAQTRRRRRRALPRRLRIRRRRASRTREPGFSRMSRPVDHATLTPR